MCPDEPACTQSSAIEGHFPGFDLYTFLFEYFLFFVSLSSFESPLLYHISADAKFQEVGVAYQILSNDKARRDYDHAG